MGILDSLTKNPGLLGLAALGIGLFIFRDKISDFVSGISGGAKAVKTTSDISNTLLDNLLGNLTGTQKSLDNLTDTFGNFQSSVGGQFDSINNQFLGLGDFFNNLFKKKDEFDIDQSSKDAQANELNKSDDLTQVFRPLDFIPERTSVSFGTEIIVPASDELGFGGGPSFIGGTTTFGDNLIDTLSEVLAIFPNLTASQARDTLEENQGLTGSQFRLINPDVINISNADEGGDTGPVTSDPNFTGLTPEQIAQILTGGNISNF